MLCVNRPLCVGYSSCSVFIRSNLTAVCALPCLAFLTLNFKFQCINQITRDFISTVYEILWWSMVVWVQDLLTHPVYSRAHFLPYLWVSRLEAASQIGLAPGRVLWGNETVISGRNLRPLHLQVCFVSWIPCRKAAHIATMPTFKFWCLSGFIVIL